MEDRLRKEIDRRVTRYWAGCQASEQQDFAAKAFDKCLRELEQKELRTEQPSVDEH